MLPQICDLQSIEKEGAAVIQEFGFVTLKDDYGSVINPVVGLHSNYFCNYFYITLLVVNFSISQK